MEANEPLKQQLGRIRLSGYPLLNLGNIAQKTVPKLCLVAPPQHGGLVCTGTFIPHAVYHAIGVLGAVSAAIACLLAGSVAEGFAVIPDNPGQGYPVENPTGEFTAPLEQHFRNAFFN